MLCAGSEDNSFKLWNGAGACLQTVELPGCVWTVSTTANGDVVAGTADGCAYIFSGASDRQDPIEGERLQARIVESKANAAPAGASLARCHAWGISLEWHTRLIAWHLRPYCNAMLAPCLTYMACLAPYLTRPKSFRRLDTRCLAESDNAGVPEEQIKPESALLMPGTSDNQTIFVRKDGKIYAYAWGASACEWQTLGEVVGKNAGDNMEKPKIVRAGDLLMECVFSFCQRVALAELALSSCKERVCSTLPSLLCLHWTAAPACVPPPRSALVPTPQASLNPRIRMAEV